MIRLDTKRSKAVIEELGGVRETAKRFGISHPAVSHWVRLGIPADRVQYIQLRFPRLESVKAIKDFKPWERGNQ